MPANTRAPDLVSMYIKDIRGFPSLTRDKERELSERIKQGDKEATKELIQSNLLFVISVANEYKNRGLEFLDLISAGNIGLITAADRFDGSRGLKFITYAVWWIRQSILKAIGEKSREIRLPLNKIALIRRLNEAIKSLNERNGYYPDVEDIALEMDIAPEQVEDLLFLSQNTRSLDQESAEEDFEKSFLLRTVPDSTVLSTDHMAIKVDLREKIEDAFKTLDEREQRILRLYFGLNGEMPLTLEQVGGLVGLTRERVRQIKEGAFGKIRERMGDVLRNLLDYE